MRRRDAVHGVTTYPPGRHFAAISDRYTGKLFFVVDISGSMEGARLAAAKTGATALLTAAVQRGYIGGVITYSGSADVGQRLTTDLRDIERCLERLSVRWTGTNLAAGIARGHKELRSFRGDRVLAVFTDGETDDRSAAIRAATKAKADGVRIIGEFAGTADPAMMREIVSDDDEEDQRRTAASDAEVAGRIAGLIKRLT